MALSPWDRARRRARDGEGAFSLAQSADARGLVDSEAAIRSASALEAYYAIKRRGLADATHALGFLSKEQIQTVLDLEVWAADTLDIPELLTWLEAFREAGLDALARAAKALDPEALAALFRRRLLIAHKPSDDRSDEDPVPAWLTNPPPDIEPIVETPDGRYLIAARARDERTELEDDDEEEAEEEKKQVLALVGELYLDEDWGFVAHILRVAMDDLTTNLEEDAFRWRSARIEDLGFVPFERAVAVYAPLAPEALLAPAARYGGLAELRLPRLHVEALGRGRLEAALRGLDAKALGRVEGELLAVANAVLGADRIAPADLDAVEATLERLKATVELALAYGVPPEDRDDVATDRLEAQHAQTLFRVGFTLTAQRAARARALCSRLPELGLSAWTGPERYVLEGLSSPRPRFRSQAEDRPFSTPEDLEWVDSALERMERELDAFERAGLLVRAPEEAWPEDPVEHDLDLRLGTALASALGDGRLGFVPLSEEAVLALFDRLGVAADRRLPVPDAVKAHPELLPRAERVLAELSASWFSLVGRERVDLRFVEGVLRDRRAPPERSRP